MKNFSIGTILVAKFDVNEAKKKKIDLALEKEFINNYKEK